jgi:hypothetical protein
MIASTPTQRRQIVSASVVRHGRPGRRRREKIIAEALISIKQTT